MADKLKHYRDNLRHVVRPDKPREREQSAKVTLADYEALYLARLLREYAAYGAPVKARDIAWAYAEYINMVVRDEGRPSVTLYAHTREAYETLEAALTTQHGMEPEMQTGLRKSIDKMREDVLA